MNRSARLVILVWFALLIPAAAWAQTKNYPAILTGQATMSVTTTSASVNAANVTLSTNSSGFPTGNLPNGYIRIKEQVGQTGTVAVCWTGGTCTMAAGEVLAIGEAQSKSIPWNIGSTPPSVIASAGTISIEIEW